MRRFLLIVSLLLLAAFGTGYVFRSAIRDVVAARLKPPLPKAQPYHPIVAEAATATGSVAVPPKSAPTPASSTRPVPVTAPPVKEANLDVPFMSQAPHGDWSLPFQEACEEASLIMIDAYYKNAGPFTPDAATDKILDLVEWENNTLGFYEDTTADEVARIAREYFHHARSEAVAIRSMDDVKKQIDAGVPVLLPAAGRLLMNPYFSGQGPLYHMVVVKGYADGRIIANDPGTRRGADYLYDPAVLWNAVHDWNGGDVEHGRKVMVLVRD